ncbi:hypothetical protein H477_2356 [[Clostridium] sordellii ATCC 9714]|nr:hypothetical protein H477_2356 [[Clostridium] sordellii ATCC 9714] [Paeniclostridium sordellii ATCC 9714]
MTKEEGIVAAKNCYDFLKEGGYIRVAVPDKTLKMNGIKIWLR